MAGFMESVGLLRSPPRTYPGVIAICDRPHEVQVSNERSLLMLFACVVQLCLSTHTVTITLAF